jgi:Zn-dependent protease with chaperone function
VNRSLSFLALVAGTTLLLASPAGATASRARDAFDQQIAAQLQVESAEAARLFAEANAARERDDHANASRLYGLVYKMVPRFVHALRRQAGEELALGHRQQAIALGRAALAADASAENLTGLALALAREVNGSKPTADEVAEALRLAQQAVQKAPDDFFANAGLCQIALRGQDTSPLKQGVERLLQIADDEAATHEFAAILAAEEGRFDDAEHQLTRAHELGMPDAEYQGMRAAIREARPATYGLGSLLLRALGAWVGALLLLFGCGALLSRAVLHAAEAMPTEASGRAQGAPALVRRAYAVVLWLSCAYYYVSMPILALVVLVAGGGIVYACFAIGHVPIKLVAIVVIVTFATLWSILKSLFVRAKDEDPGEPLDLRTQPRLRALLVEVARRLGTRPVENVYLTPGTEVAVMERGGMWRQLRGSAERCLILGVGVLEGLKIGPFKAVIAHEYGHFSNRDTAGGGLALGVRRSLFTMAKGLAESGTAHWYNPAWIFLNVFFRVFMRISQGASRLQEILADRWAAFTYGSKAFETGLRHVIEQSVRFEARAGATLGETLRTQTALVNLYQHALTTPVPEEQILKAVTEALHRPPSVYDSHPSPTERTRWVRALNAKGTTAGADDAQDVWTLFADRDKIEERMTGRVRDMVYASQGVRIAG